MANLTKEIFLASRFQEFAEIRGKLAEKINAYHFMEAIDLNDNQASHRSPLGESLFHVRKSEIMILLVGETYGTVPEGEKKSYTHLEYLEAVKESSNTRVLVFCVGKPYAGNYIAYSKTDEKMKEWQIELEKNHRLSKFGDEEDIDTIVEKIMIMLLSSVYELNPEENLVLSQDDELYLDEIQDGEENLLNDDEAEFLDNKLSDQGEIGITDVDEKMEGFDLLKIPGKLAALEQKKEAQRAIEIQDYYTARQHLKKALEFRPLDFETNYWLAKLYVASAKKNLFFEIEEYLLRAAKIALQDNNRFKASHCYQLIIQASIFSDKENEGLKYIALAEEITPNFARLYYEKAKFMLYFGHKKEAKHALMQAINIRMEILKDIAKDPFFLEYKDVIRDMKSEMKEHLKKSCYAIASQTNQIKQLLRMEIEEIDLNSLPIYELWKSSRRNFLEQYKILSSEISNIEDREQIMYDEETSYFEKKLMDDLEREHLMHHDERRTMMSLHQRVKDEILSEHEKRKNTILENYENIKNSIVTGTVERETVLENSMQSTYILTWILAFFSLGITIGMFMQGKLLEYVWMSILAFIGSSSAALYVYKTRKEKISQIRKEENGEFLRKEKNYNETLVAEEKTYKDTLTKEMKKYKEKLLSEKERYSTANEEIKRAYDKKKEKYEHISKAFKIFEEGTVSKSSSKLVPFKSLNSASKNSVVRVTPHSYRKYIEKGNFIDIEDDFPICLGIKAVDADNISFLAKVIKKDRSSMVLSRYRAYSDKKTENVKKHESVKGDTYLFASANKRKINE